MSNEEKVNYEMEVIDPNQSEFELLSSGFLKLSVGEKIYPKVTLNRLLPYTYEEKYISVLEDNKEIGIIEDLGEFERRQYEMIMKNLCYKYYIPEITKIKGTKEKMGFLYVEAETDAGEKEICIADFTSNIRVIKGNMMSITDVEGNKYRISDFAKLDTISRQKIDVFL